MEPARFSSYHLLGCYQLLLQVFLCGCHWSLGRAAIARACKKKLQKEDVWYECLWGAYSCSCYRVYASSVQGLLDLYTASAFLCQEFRIDYCTLVNLIDLPFCGPVRALASPFVRVIH